MTDGGVGTVDRLQAAQLTTASTANAVSARKILRCGAFRLIDLTSPQIAYPSSKLSRYGWRMSIESESRELGSSNEWEAELTSIQV